MSADTGNFIQSLRRKKRHKWFAHYSLDADEGFFGPHDTIEAAIREVICNYGPSETGPKIYVMQGYKMSMAEREEWGVEYDWQCESREALVFLRPTTEKQP